MKNESDDKILNWYMQFIISQKKKFPAKNGPSGVAFLLKLFFFDLKWKAESVKTIRHWENLIKQSKIFWSINQKARYIFLFVQIYKLLYTIELFMWEICCWRFNHLDFFFSVSVCLVHRGQYRIDKNQNRWVLRSFVQKKKNCNRTF